MTYEHREKGIRGKLIEENEKTKTVILELEDGKQQPMTTSTLKRWWKKVDEELDENDRQLVAEELATLEKCESKNIPEVLKEENKASDGTPYKQVMQEIIQDEKQAVETAKLEKKSSRKKEGVLPMEERQRLVVDVLKTAGFRTYISDKTPNTVYILDDTEKKTRGVYLGGAKCVLGLPEKEVPNGAKADRIRRCKISHSFDIQYNALDKMISLLSKIKKEDK